MLTIQQIDDILKEYKQANNEAKESMLGYARNVAKVLALQKKLNQNKKLMNKYQKEVNNLQNRATRTGQNLSQQEQVRLQILQQQLGILSEQNEYISAQTEALRGTNNIVNLIFAGSNSILNVVGKIGTKLKLNYKYWTDNMRAVRSSEKSMGILSTQTETYRSNLEGMTYVMADLGMHLADIVAVQNSFATQLERNLILREDEIRHISGVAKGLDMTLETSAEMFALMQDYGKSVTESDKMVNRLARDTRKSGLNSLKVMERFHDTLKKADKYRFKDGVKGMQEMSKYATMFKAEFDVIAGFADKVFDVEGAIEMGAQLQVLGGRWAQMSDPMQLMFKARNDMQGLQTDIINATSELGKFNEEGEFEIESVQLDRIRKLAEMTGMTKEQLVDMAKATARVNAIKMDLSSSVPEHLREFVMNTAKMGKNGNWVMDINGKDVDVKNLGGYVGALQTLMKDKDTLEEKAKKAQLFDEKLDNLIIKAKSLLYPILNAFDKGFEPLLTKMVAWLNENKEPILDAMKTVAGVITKTFKWIYDNPIEAGLIAVGTYFSKTILAGAMWFANGIQFGLGAQSVLNGPGGPGGGAGGALGQGIFGNNRNWGKMGRMAGWGALAGAGGLALDYGGDWLANKGHIQKDGGAHQAMGYGAKALEFGGIGAMIGSMIAPGIGTAIGAGIGGLAGVGYQAYQNSNKGMANDFISRPGSDPIKFNSADTLVGLKKDGGLGKALLNQAGVGGSNTDNSNINFGSPLQINGEIKIVGSNGASQSLDLNDPVLLREVTRMVQEQMNRNIAGKSTASPI